MSEQIQSTEPRLEVPEEGTNTQPHRGVESLPYLLAALLAACGGGTEGSPEPALGLFDFAKANYQPWLLLPRSDEGTGPQTKAAATPSATAFMDWAESVHAGHFPPHQTDIRYSGSNPGYSGMVYRFYPSTGNYLIVWNSLCFVMGPISNGGLTNVGTLATYAEAVAATPSVNGPFTDVEAARFLLHAQFSASEGEIAAVRQKGYVGWLEEQFNRPIAQTGWDWLVSKGYSVIDTNEYFFSTQPVYYMVWQELMNSPDALRKRWALAMSEMFVVATEGTMMLNWPSFAVAGYWDVLCRNGFGSFRTLIEQITLTPAMGTYLNTLGNQKEDPATGRVPDENYAREVMQLFTIGLQQLNLDGTPKLGADGRPIDTYTQSDVTNLARVFTGYTLDYGRVGRFQSPKPPYNTVHHLDIVKGSMTLDPNRHSSLAVNFLGTSIPANTPAAQALSMALDTLCNHPNTGPFFARQMIQRLVTSNPTPAYVARVASAFNDNGSGIRGDLKAVLRAILTDSEATGAAGLSDPTFGKLREPMLRLAQWARTFKAVSQKGTWKVRLWEGDPLRYVYQNPLNPPSVFNYFRPGYVPPATAMAARGATAPEFQIIDDSSVAAYINLLSSTLWNGIYVRAPELPNNPENPTPTDGPDIVPDYSAELALVLDDAALVRRLNLLLCAGQLSQATQDYITNALSIDKVSAGWNEQGKRAHVVRAILFVMCAAEYLIQK